MIALASLFYSRWNRVDSDARRIVIAACSLLLAATLARATDTSKQQITTPTTGQPTVKSTSHKKSTHRKSRRSSRRGQQRIDHDRALQIQQALIREHYLNGKASGVWDNATQAAMQKYQADNGWQSKTTPDSRALIKLGLGPNNEHLLNPESAMTSQPQAHSTTAPSPSADAATARPQN
ncbi:MAG: peptidoglycan-binding protein [Acidobacteriaceae bacterium]|nr:peptidoglycan-binding protein [Acidobacteriaceae bacterium]